MDKTAGKQNKPMLLVLKALFVMYQQHLEYSLALAPLAFLAFPLISLHLGEEVCPQGC